MKQITFKRVSKKAAMAVAVAIALVGGVVAAVLSSAPPTNQSDVAAAASQRAVVADSMMSRSHNRFTCDENGCDKFAPQPPKLVVKKPPVVKKKPTTSSTSTVGKGCTRLVATVWHGPCPKVSKAYAVAAAKQLLAARGWSGQFGCLNSIIYKESGWNVYAVNPSSHSYGIPQALPGIKLAKAGSNWGWDAKVQIKWMLGYIAARYKTPCGAWAFWQSNHWY